MRLNKKILLLGDGSEPLIEIEGLLRVAGYTIKTLTDAQGAVNLYDFSKHSPEPFDLLIASVEPCKLQFLVTSQRTGIIDKLLFINNVPRCRELYCVEEGIGHLCHNSATLACVQEVLKDNLEAITLKDCIVSQAFQKLF